MPSYYQNFSRERERRGRFTEYANPMRQFASRYRTHYLRNQMRYWARVFDLQREFGRHAVSYGHPTRNVRQRRDDF